MNPTSDPLLFTPGPVTTSPTVKAAAHHDEGSRSEAFSQTITEIRQGLLEIAGVSEETHTAVLIPGSGTYSIESVISSTMTPNDTVLMIVNGSYGIRIEKMLTTYLTHTAINLIVLRYEWNEAVSPQEVRRYLYSYPDINHVIIVHHETTTGILNPLEEIGQMIQRENRLRAQQKLKRTYNSNKSIARPPINFIVDAMSSFGGISFDYQKVKPTYLVSSGNKCLQGIPGCCYVIAEREHLKHHAIYSKTLSLDLKDQWEFMEKNQQCRFTPPVQAVLALHQAIKEYREEGGLIARSQRYQANQRLMVQGMGKIGFTPYVDQSIQGPIITTFCFPIDFDFPDFASRLAQLGIVIYTGKMKKGTFRVGNIGHLFETDICFFLDQVEYVINKMKLPINSKS